MFRVLHRLFPVGLPWRLLRDGPLRRIIQALADALDAARLEIDSSALDHLAAHTRRLSDHEHDLAMWNVGLDEPARRDRIAGARRATGATSPAGIQRNLQALGFGVYVHQWWVPGSAAPQGLPSARDITPYFWPHGAGKLIRNKLRLVERYYIHQLGSPLMRCGEPLARLGAFAGSSVRTEAVALSEAEESDSVIGTYHPAVVLIGGQTFGAFADVPSARRDEFEWWVLHCLPAEAWAGLLINYT